ncbi:hypothetical protein ACLESO_15970 [Pyxidicoccus sp. 3LG]
MSKPGSPGAGAQWNSRFSVQEYVYGTKPNDFLVESAPSLPGDGGVIPTTRRREDMPSGDRLPSPTPPMFTDRIHSERLTGTAPSVPGAET